MVEDSYNVLNNVLKDTKCLFKTVRNVSRLQSPLIEDNCFHSNIHVVSGSVPKAGLNSVSGLLSVSEKFSRLE